MTECHPEFGFDHAGLAVGAIAGGLPNPSYQVAITPIAQRLIYPP
jgi:hypothetical protein